MRVPKVIASIKSTPYANGRHAVYVQINFNGLREFISLAQAILKEDWNPETELCYENDIDKRKGNKRDGIKTEESRTEPLAKQINERINQHKQVAGLVIRMAQDKAVLAGQSELPLTAATLKNEILAQLAPGKKTKVKAGPVQDKSFFEFCEEVCEDLEKAGKIGLAKRYASASSKLRTWLDRDILFSELNKTLLMDYYNKGLIKGLRNRKNTAHTSIRILKTLYRRAKADHNLAFLKDMADPFEGVSVPNGKPEEIHKLLIDDIKRIEALTLTPGTNTDLARDVFIFCFYAAGMRVRDAIQLKWTNITKDNSGINYIEGKTGKEKYVPIKDQVGAILGKYRGNKSKFVFGMLQDYQTDDALVLYNACSSCQTTLNNNLKTIGELAEISIGSENLSTHVARHTFVSIVYEKTKDIRLIQKICNHSSIKTTEDYLKRLSPEEFSKEMSDVLDMITE